MSIFRETSSSHFLSTIVFALASSAIMVNCTEPEPEPKVADLSAPFKLNTTRSTDLPGVYAMAMGNGRLITVGIYGNSYTEDGIKWTYQYGRLNQNDVTFAFGNFISAGKGIYVSPDGLTWNSASKVGSQLFFGIGNGGGLAVAVGDSGRVLTSTEGTYWERQESGTDKPLFGLTYSDREFIVVGALGTILVSRDGKQWEQRNSNSQANLSAVAWNGKVLVAVGDAILRSSNGNEWTVASETGFNGHLTSVAWGRDRFIAAGDDGKILVSANGEKWEALTYSQTSVLLGATDRLYAVNFDFGKFFIGGVSSAVGGGEIFSEE